MKIRLTCLDVFPTRPNSKEVTARFHPTVFQQTEKVTLKSGETVNVDKSVTLHADCNGAWPQTEQGLQDAAALIDLRGIAAGSFEAGKDYTLTFEEAK